MQGVVQEVANIYEVGQEVAKSHKVVQKVAKSLEGWA